MGAAAARGTSVLSDGLGYMIVNQGAAYGISNTIQRSATREKRVIGRMLETEPVTFKPRKDVEVGVKDFLSRGDTIRKKEIDAFTTNAACPNGGR